jgi:hypothetical protein
MVHMGGFRISSYRFASTACRGAMLWQPTGSFEDTMNGKDTETFARLELFQFRFPFVPETSK